MQENISVIMEEISSEEPPVFTRYLYSKDDVEYSFYQSCIDKKEEESFFWGYELYYSGFPESVYSILRKIMEETPRFHKRIRKKIEKQIEEWNPEKEEESAEKMIGILIKNVVLYLHHPSPTTTREPQKKRIFLLIHKSQIECYQTINPEKIETYRSWNVLKQTCIFSSIKTSEFPESIREKWYYDWIYYASFSPIWLKRIKQFKGKRIHEKIVFPDEDSEEAFYELYGYEPDEQPRDVQEKMICL